MSLESNNFLCACIGCINNEPHCPCSMVRLGLKTSKDYEPSQEVIDALAKALDDVFGRHKNG